MMNKIFILLLYLRKSNGFENLYSKWKCSNMSSLGGYVTISFHFVLRENCELFISTRPIREQEYSANYLSCGRNREPILFPWNSDNLAILLHRINGKYFRIVDAVEMLERRSKQFAPISVNMDNVDDFIRLNNIEDQVTLKSCYRCPPRDQQKFCCISLENRTKLVEYEFLWEDYDIWKMNETSYTMPNLVYGDSVATYLSDNYEPYIWINHRNNWFYNFKFADLKEGHAIRGNNTYVILDSGPNDKNDLSILYADAGGIITKSCRAFQSDCLYRYSTPKHKKKEKKKNSLSPIPLKSFCLYYETIDIYPVFVFKSWTSPYANIKYVDIPNQRGGMEDMIEKEQAPSASHKPVQVLGFITIIYVCFFFFYAFRPHQASNLVELSAMMEDELTRLSTLTNEAVEKLKIARAEEIPPAIFLMKHPEDPTQESLEDVCCPGSTCEASLCINGRPFIRKLSSKRRLFDRRAEVRTSGVNAISGSAGKKIDVMIVPIAKCEKQHGGRHVAAAKRARKPQHNNPLREICRKRRPCERRNPHNRKYKEEKQNSKSKR